MEGTPAKLIMARLIIRVKILSGAYSLRYMAAATPNGTEKSKPKETKNTVPARAGNTPPAVIPLMG